MNSLICLILTVLPLTAPDPKLAALVWQLGNPSFAIRETATRELVRAGPSAVPALAAGMKNADPEISGRCGQLLPNAVCFERNQKLAELLKDPAKPPPKGLVGAENFLEITGDTKEARQLYAEMMGEYHTIIEGAGKNPEATTKLLDAVIMDSDTFRMEGRERPKMFDRASHCHRAALLMLADSDSRLPGNHRRAKDICRLVTSEPLWSAVVGTPKDSPARKVFVHWLGFGKQGLRLDGCLEMAADAGITEALPVVVKLLRNVRQPPLYPAELLLDLQALGTKANIKDAAPFLEDKTLVDDVNPFGDGPLLSIQIRDVALGVSIRLAGGNLADFGFDWPNLPPVTRPRNYILAQYGFLSESRREAAHAKWKAWTGKQGWR